MIRLARIGKTKKPYFRVVVSEKTKDTHGDYLEGLGHIDPHTNPRDVVLKAERIKYWLGQGAKASPSVHNILVDQGIIKDDKKRVWKPKKKAVAETAAAAPTAAVAKPAEAA